MRREWRARSSTSVLPSANPMLLPPMCRASSVIAEGFAVVLHGDAAGGGPRAGRQFGRRGRAAARRAVVRQGEHGGSEVIGRARPDVARDHEANRIADLRRAEAGVWLVGPDALPEHSLSRRLPEPVIHGSRALQEGVGDVPTPARRARRWSRGTPRPCPRWSSRFPSSAPSRRPSRCSSRTCSSSGQPCSRRPAGGRSSTATPRGS